MLLKESAAELYPFSICSCSTEIFKTICASVGKGMSESVFEQGERLLDPKI